MIQNVPSVPQQRRGPRDEAPLSVCRKTVGLSENCWTLSDTTVTLLDRAQKAGSQWIHSRFATDSRIFATDSHRDSHGFAPDSRRFAKIPADDTRRFAWIRACFAGVHLCTPLVCGSGYLTDANHATGPYLLITDTIISTLRPGAARRILTLRTLTCAQESATKGAGAST